VGTFSTRERIVRTLSGIASAPRDIPSATVRTAPTTTMTRAVAALFLGALLMAAPATADEDVNLPEAQRNALQEAALKLAGFQAADLMFEGTAMGVPDEQPVKPEPVVRASSNPRENGVGWLTRPATGGSIRVTHR
jgi:hypothetical protein